MFTPLLFIFPDKEYHGICVKVINTETFERERERERELNFHVTRENERKKLKKKCVLIKTKAIIVQVINKAIGI